MRIEGHDAGPQPSSAGRVDHAEMTAVNAVEGADGN